MKLTTTVPPPVPPPPRKHTLELTNDQLLALGLLSYRHESRDVGATFWDHLPDEERRVVLSMVTTEFVNQNSDRSTKTRVDWGAEP